MAPEKRPDVSLAIKRAKKFETEVRDFLSDKTGLHLMSKEVTFSSDANRKHSCDIVSQNNQVVGDAKYLRNIPIPAAKYDNITAYIHFLQNIEAHTKFLVFGENKELPNRWLKRFENLAEGVEFYFYADSTLEKLTDGPANLLRLFKS